MSLQFYFDRCLRLLGPILVPFMVPLSTAWAGPNEILNCRQAIEGRALFELKVNEYQTLNLLNRPYSRLQLPEFQFFTNRTEITKPELWIAANDRVYRLRTESDGSYELKVLQIPEVGPGQKVRISIEKTLLSLTRSPKGHLWIENVQSKSQLETQENLRKRRKLPESEGDKAENILERDWDPVEVSWTEALSQRETFVIQRFALALVRSLKDMKVYEENTDLIKLLGPANFEQKEKSILKALNDCKGLIPEDLSAQIEKEAARLLRPLQQTGNNAP